MRGESATDVVVVGSGPNGLAAAIHLARSGRSVLVLEAAQTIGGGMRSGELTLPGFTHDICSAIHPLGVGSPFLRQLPLAEHGLEWVHPAAPLAHPLADGRVFVVERELAQTLSRLTADRESYRNLVAPFLKRTDPLFEQILGPLGVPRHPLLMARFGLMGIRSARYLAEHRFQEETTRGMFAGLAAHAVLPLERPLTAAVGLMFALTAHAYGWPLPRGGSQRLADAMASYLRSLGGSIETERRVHSLEELGRPKAILFDVTPRQLNEIAGDALPERYRRTLRRFRHGPGVFKVDWALRGPIPWRAAECHRAGTVHVGGTFDEVAAAERAAWTQSPAEHPFLLVAQQSLFDATRAPAGKQTAWAYCHVPHACEVDMTDRVETQMERFAPGFRDLILERHVMSPADLQAHNPNYLGGDITGGVMDLRQIFARPALRLSPYTTPAKHIFLCSASTPPGAGVHGMCGFHAAEAALRTVLR